MAELERSSKTDEVGPIVSNQVEIDGALRNLLERAVIGGAVDAPELCAANIRQSRAELIAEQPEKAENGVGISGGVGHDFLGIEFGLLFEQQGEDDETVAQGSRHDGSVEAGELIGEHVVPGEAARPAIIFWVGSGMDGACRSDETHAVGRGDFAGTPMLDKRQFAVGCDNEGAGGVERFRADEVLADPGKPVAAQGWNILTDHRFKPDIAGLANQSGAQADIEMFDPRLALAQMRESSGEASSRHRFEEDIGHADFGHAALNGGAQEAQALGIDDLIERRDDKFGFSLDGFDAQIGVGRRTGGDLAKGFVEQAAEAVDFGLGVKRAIERAANHQLGFLPSRAVQKSASGIAIAMPGLAKTSRLLSAMRHASMMAKT